MKPSRICFLLAIVIASPFLPFVYQAGLTPLGLFAFIFWLAIVARLAGGLLKFGAMVSFLDRDRTKS
jgi:hypothetical protein